MDIKYANSSCYWTFKLWNNIKNMVRTMENIDYSVDQKYPEVSSLL